MTSPSNSPKRRPPPDEFLELPARIQKAMKGTEFEGRGGQGKLATRAGISGGHLSALLDGKRLGGVQAALVIHLARALSVNAGWLLTGHGEMHNTAAPVITEDFVRKLVHSAIASERETATKKP